MGVKIFGIFAAILIVTYDIVGRIRYHNKIMRSTKIKNIEYQRAIMNTRVLVSMGMSVLLLYTVFTFEEKSYNALNFNIILICILLVRSSIEQILKIIFKRKIKKGELTEEIDELSVENKEENS